MSAALRLAGMLLLTGTGTGGGWALYQRRYEAWRQVHVFAELIDHIAAAIRYQAWPCAQILAGAARDVRFAGLGLEGCTAFSQLPVPPALGGALAAQARQTLCGLGAVPHERACATLAALLAGCRRCEAQAWQQAREARRLYPRLGFFAGLATALILG